MLIFFFRHFSPLRSRRTLGAFTFQGHRPRNCSSAWHSNRRPTHSSSPLFPLFEPDTTQHCVPSSFPITAAWSRPSFPPPPVEGMQRHHPTFFLEFLPCVQFTRRTQFFSAHSQPDTNAPSSNLVPQPGGIAVKRLPLFCSCPPVATRSAQTHISQHCPSLISEASIVVRFLGILVIDATWPAPPTLSGCSLRGETVRIGLPDSTSSMD